jgi:hypothetical protein
MKIKQLLSIAALLGVSLIPALPSHSQFRNPCQIAPDVKPSSETREIRVEKYGIAFNIPDNYRTTSYITDSKMYISIDNPSVFDFNGCLTRNKVPTDEIVPSSAEISIDSRSRGSLTEIAKQGIAKQGRYRKNFRKITFKNEPAIGFESRLSEDLYDSVLYDSVLFFLPSRKSSVDISINRIDKALGETIKSSFTFINR